MEFKTLKLAVQKQMDKMVEGELFFVELDKYVLYDLYLSSFPEGTNPTYKERTEHDCNCCKQFIRGAGSIVALVDGELTSVWDITVDNEYQVVADTLATFVKSHTIKSIFRNDSNHLGVDLGGRRIINKVHTWEHFHYKLPNKFVMNKDSIATYQGNFTSNHGVLVRSLDEISLDAIEIVQDLIAQKSLYRGEEHLRTVSTLNTLKVEWDNLPSDDKVNYSLLKSVELGDTGKFRNTVIGTLLSDISGGIDLEVAVKKFEDKVAPHNYKRPKALITQGMIDKAQKTVAELNIEDSLPRRFAATEDITINNVLFADRSAKKSMGIFDELSANVKDKKPNLDKVEEVSIEDFINNILPKAESLELMMENSHTGNLVSLISPKYKEAKGIFKWSNNFSWSYNGEVADSMKERVKAAGGRVEGDIRFSIQWNEDGNNENDLDAHCLEPTGRLIDYTTKGRVHPSSGMLDVDIVSPDGKVAVENIIYSDRNKMTEGIYTFLVHNYSDRGGVGFSAEMEFDGKVINFTYDKKIKNQGKVVVAKVKYTKANGFELVESLPHNETAKQVWNINTCKWNKVEMVLHSPNHWDGEETGNKHWFFMLEGCTNPDKARGFYNEFLTNNLTEHRKVFEVLASKMKTEKTDNQLSGLGFSSTQNNSVLCKVSGTFNRVVKINF